MAEAPQGLKNGGYKSQGGNVKVREVGQGWTRWMEAMNLLLEQDLDWVFDLRQSRNKSAVSHGSDMS